MRRCPRGQGAHRARGCPCRACRERGSCLLRVVVEEWDWRAVVVCVGEEVMAAAWLHIVEARQWRGLLRVCGRRGCLGRRCANSPHLGWWLASEKPCDRESHRFGLPGFGESEVWADHALGLGESGVFVDLRWPEGRMSWFEAYGPLHSRFYSKAMSPTDGGPHQCRGNFWPGGRAGHSRSRTI